MSSQLPCRVTWLLEFSGAPELEQGWRQYRMTSTCLTADTAVLTVNAIANALLLLRVSLLVHIPMCGKLCLLVNLLLSAAQAALVRVTPEVYLRWRTLFVCTARLVRVIVVISMCRVTTALHPTTWLATALQLMLLSPASASFFPAVALPLPLRSHAVLQAVVTSLTLMQAEKLCQQFPPSMQTTRCDVLHMLSQRVGMLNPFSLNVLPRTPAAGMDCCVPFISAIVITYGMVLSSLVVFSMELVSRTKYLRQASQLPSAMAAELVRVMRAVWLVSCLIGLSALPILWELVLLVQRLWQVGVSSYGVAGLAAIGTSLFLESFMRAWLALVLILVSSFCSVILGL